MEVNKVKLVLMGPDKDVLDKQQAMLFDLVELNINVICTKTIVDNISQYIHEANNIVVVNLTTNALHELNFLEGLGDKQSSMIIIGDQSDVAVLKQAIRAGVKDFIDEKDYQDKLVPVFMNLTKNIKNNQNSKQVRRLNAFINVFINAKGGSGTSFIASNMAYILSKEAQLNVALIDLDLQFGSIGNNFDRTPKYSLIQAVNAIEELDSNSLDAYLSKYNENLSLLLPLLSEITLPGELNVAKLKKLLALLKVNFNQIVIDLPRLIDPVSSMVMDQADQVVVVLQQSLIQFRDGRRMIDILNKDLNIPLNKIAIVINRYDPQHSLRVSDLSNFVNHDKIYTVSNDFERAVAASNLGVPLFESSVDSPIAEELKTLAGSLGLVELKKKKKNFFSFLS
jgi:pilus assembly protein CpaE